VSELDGGHGSGGPYGSLSAGTMILAGLMNGIQLRRPPRSVASLSAVLACTAVGGCGLNVNSADLFVLTRTGEGRTLTLLVNDGGTIRCNGGKARTLPDALLLRARDLAARLDKDAKARLALPRRADSVFIYKMRLQDGTISFPDTAASTDAELARAEQFVQDAAHGPCGLSR